MEFLVIGGNKFFGKRLVKMLLAEGHKVTKINRGNHQVSPHPNLTHFPCDRNDSKKMKSFLEDKNFDVVFDQCCFNAKTAELSCELFQGKTKKYIFTSTQSVYNSGANLLEMLHDPANPDSKEEFFEYARNKREAEVVFHNSEIPVTMVRFPLVLGAEDPSKRLHFHIQFIKEEREIFFDNLDAKISFIHAEEAAKALYFLANNSFEGPINIASLNPMRLQDFIERIEKHTGKKLKQAKKKTDETQSPYNIPSDWYMNTQLMNQLGFKTLEVVDWIDDIIIEVIKAG